MYFTSRMQAGRMLASQISAKYQGENSAVLALSDGGVVVGMQIAQQLKAPLGLLLVEEIELPQEFIAIAGISQDGSFSYNQAYSKGEIEELVSEYRGFIEAQKLEKIQSMQWGLGDTNLIRRELLEHRNIILVTDGMATAFSLELAMEYLKPVNHKKLIVATPLATIGAVDRMHILADDLFVLYVPENFINTDHYYDQQDVPDHEVVVGTVGRLLRSWPAPDSGNPPH